MLISVSLRPDTVHFDWTDQHEEFPINEDASAFEIEHQYGRLTITVREKKLSLDWGPSEELVPNGMVTTSYYRADDSLYYPEVLITVPGHVLALRAT